MSTATAAFDTSVLRPAEVAGIWVRHLTSLLLPLNALVYVWTGPHAWYIAPFFIVPIALAYALDTRERVELRQPVASLPAWPFDALVYLLAAMQLLIVFELGRMFSVQGIFSIDMLLVLVIVGGSSGFSIITAHELIHRRRGWEQQLGRLLLCTVLYEHFYTEHLRGHHVRVGTAEDPATARFGETYRDFWRRTVPAQFGSAWKLEAARLGDPDMRLLDRRMLGNRILHGVAVGWGIALAVWLGFGLAAFIAFLIQAFFAVRLLEAVNYFEHWGLTRTGSRVRPIDSWDTHTWFTYYGLVGLSRHADHHTVPTRPYQQLRIRDDVPILPSGYVGMVDLVMGKNDEFRRLATEELRRKGLGPFVGGGEPEVTETGAEEASEPSGLRAAWMGIAAPLRVGLVAAAAVLVASLGIQLETGAAEMGLGARILLNGWIAAVFAAVLAGRSALKKVVPNEAVTWAAAFALLLVLGRLTQLIVG